jgi:hypothetical protein
MIGIHSHNASKNMNQVELYNYSSCKISAGGLQLDTFFCEGVKDAKDKDCQLRVAFGLQFLDV